MKKLLIALALIVPSFLSAQQVSRSVTATNGVLVPFLEFKPPTYDANPGATFPLIIFLHGIGERGDGTISGLVNLLGVGIPRYIRDGSPMTFTYNGQTSSFLVISPQLSFAYGQWQNFYIDEVIKYAKQNLRVDPNRIYLTGLSLGGGGVWKYASSSAAAASNLAAIAPVCATAEWSNLCNIAQNRVAVWGFHAYDDGIVGVGSTQSGINGINACGPQITAKATYYNYGNHYIWDMAYDMTHGFQSPQNLFEWFLSYSRSGTPPPPPPPGNSSPIANAGSDQWIATASAGLNGNGSSDPDGSITSYSWSQVSGPNTASFGSSTAAYCNVSNLVGGTYVFRLRVTDNGGASSTDDITINVAQSSPTPSPAVAAAGADQYISLPTNKAYLVGSGSYSQGGGSITSYVWSQVSGPNTASLAAMASSTPSNWEAGNLVGGTYVFRLTVTNNTGGTGTDDMQVVVSGGSQSVPVANAGSNQTLTLPTNSTALNGSGSSGSNLSYNWSLQSGPSQYSLSSPNIANPTVTNLTAGTYTFKLSVSDVTGATSTANVQVAVNQGSSGGGANPAIAAAGADKSITLPTNSVWLIGSGSYSQGGGSITSYGWSQVSGPNTATLSGMSSSNYEAKNLIAGTYVFRLTVTNTFGNTGTDDVQVIVSGTTPPPPPPSGGGGNTVAAAGPDQSITLPTSSVILIGSGSYAVNGYITGFNWAQVSGPNTASLTSYSPSNYQASGLVGGTYVFRLTVTSNSGGTATDDIQITVNGGTGGGGGGGSVPGAPTANATANTLYLTLPNSLILIGSGSYDVGGWITNYAWSQVSGPTTASLWSVSSTNWQAGGLSAGTYVFKLTVTDNSGLTSSATVQVIVYGSAWGAASSNSIATESSVVSVTPISVYPNPAVSNVTVEVNNAITGAMQINFLNANGQSAKVVSATKSGTAFKQVIDISSLSAGNYVVEAKFSNGTTLTQKIVKQ